MVRENVHFYCYQIGPGKRGGYSATSGSPGNLSYFYKLLGISTK